MSSAALKSFAEAKARKITDHVFNRTSFTVGLIVKWHNSPTPTDDFTTTATFSESAVQEVDEELVLKYWKDIGGRRQATRLRKDRVFKIVEEMKRWWVVQWAGHSLENVTLEPKHEIAYKPGAGEAIVKWRESLSLVQLMEVDHFSLGIDWNNVPAWYSQLPEVDWDNVDISLLDRGDH